MRGLGAGDWGLEARDASRGLEATQAMIAALGGSGSVSVMALAISGSLALQPLVPSPQPPIPSP